MSEKRPFGKSEERKHRIISSAEVDAWNKFYDREESDVVGALSKVDVVVASVWDIVNSRRMSAAKMRRILPVLEEHVSLEGYPRVTEGMVRCFLDPSGRRSASEISTWFVEWNHVGFQGRWVDMVECMTPFFSSRDQLAGVVRAHWASMLEALAIACDDHLSDDELARLVDQHGAAAEIRGREVLVRALERRRS